MTNTYIAPGDAEPEDVISEVERGFYAVRSPAARSTRRRATSSSASPRAT